MTDSTTAESQMSCYANDGDSRCGVALRMNEAALKAVAEHKFHMEYRQWHRKSKTAMRQFKQLLKSK